MKQSISLTPALAKATGILLILCLSSPFIWAQTPVEQEFELDGNAIDETDIGNADAFMPDDWAEADATTSSGYVAGPTVDGDNPGGGADISAFINDPNGDSGMDNIFTTGGSKDDLPITGWKWTLGTPPDKDDLLQVGAAAYLPGGNELLIYDFGSLYAANGTSSIGNWFFKKDIGPCSNGKFGVVDSSDPSRPCLPDDQQPDSLHTIGDILIISENTDGGKVTNISVYKWVAGDASECTALGHSFVPPKDNLCLIGSFAASTCGDASADPYACGIMNQQDTESPDDYGYVSKFPPDPAAAHPADTNGIDSGDYPTVTFFESGINISEVLGNAECFSSFMKNTRTSASPRSQLKDFAGGAFELCGIDVVKRCPETRVGSSDGFCADSDEVCSSDNDCDTDSSEQCLTSNPLFLFGDTVRTQFSVTISKKGPADLANVQLKEVTQTDCHVIAVDGSEISPILLPHNDEGAEWTDVLASLTGNTTLTIECNTSSALTSNTVMVQATTSSGLSQVGPETHTMIDSNCGPAPDPGLNLLKECNGRVKLVRDNSSGDIVFRVPVKITVSNTGNEDLSSIVVKDKVDGQFRTIDSNLSLAKGDPPKVYTTTYDTTLPDGITDQTEWLGCEIRFSDLARIEAARGILTGALPSAKLPPDYPATCIFCEDCGE